MKIEEYAWHELASDDFKKKFYDSVTQTATLPSELRQLELLDGDVTKEMRNEFFDQCDAQLAKLYDENILVHSFSLQLFGTDDIKLGAFLTVDFLRDYENNDEKSCGNPRISVNPSYGAFSYAKIRYRKLDKKARSDDIESIEIKLVDIFDKYDLIKKKQKQLSYLKGKS